MSASARAPRPRVLLPDALRAVALLGVVIVNAAGYATAPWGPLLGAPTPADSVSAIVAYTSVAALLQGKAYPLLAFLFGYSLVLAAPRGTGLEPSRRRLQRLLVLGLAHGLLLYFGDILTLYALTGMLVLRHLREPWRAFRPRLRRAGVGAVLATLALAALAALGGNDPSEVGLGRVADWGDFLRLNAVAYASSMPLFLLLFLPLLRALMLAGVAAARLRCLTHPRWRLAAMAWGRRWLPLMLAANLAYGVMLASTAASLSSSYAVLVSLGPLVGIPLSASAVALAIGHWHKGTRAWTRWAAPLGRMTLSLYLGHSFACALLLSGAGAGWAAGTLGTLAFALAVWGLAWCLARVTQALGLRGPFEAWIARAT